MGRPSFWYTMNITAVIVIVILKYVERGHIVMEINTSSVNRGLMRIKRDQPDANPHRRGWPLFSVDVMERMTRRGRYVAGELMRRKAAPNVCHVLREPIKIKKLRGNVSRVRRINPTLLKGVWGHQLVWPVPKIDWPESVRRKPPVAREVKCL